MFAKMIYQPLVSNQVYIGKLVIFLIVQQISLRSFYLMKPTVQNIYSIIQNGINQVFKYSGGAAQQGKIK